jgi:RNA polymerase sigma-70 factor (ECF subfamily)
VKHLNTFDNLLHRYKGLLFSLCRHFSRRGTTVEDLLQEASVALWRDRERLLSLQRGPKQAALVWKIARNAIIDDLRRNKISYPIPEDYEETSDDHSMVQELRDRIAMLDEPDHTIVVMQMEGYSYEEIAAHLDMTEKNVSVRLVRVKEKLRKSMVGENKQNR